MCQTFWIGIMQWLQLRRDWNSTAARFRAWNGSRTKVARRLQSRCRCNRCISRHVSSTLVCDENWTAWAVVVVVDRVCRRCARHTSRQLVTETVWINDFSLPTWSNYYFHEFTRSNFIKRSTPFISCAVVYWELRSIRMSAGTKGFGKQKSLE